MAARNFFSGCEGEHHYEQAVAAGATNILCSYLHLRKADPNLIKKRKDKRPHINFLCDSGAHTLQVSTGKPPYNTWSMTDYEDYLKEYVKWLKDNRNYLFSAVELDIDYCVGVAKVEEWQKRYFLPLLEQGMDICFVWHKERGIEDWERMCSTFPYVGLPGEMSSEADFNKYMTVARRYTAKVHGFAATKQSDFRDWPWYSFDSITWKTCEMYGTLIVWDEHNQKLKFEQDKTKRVKYRKIMQAMGFDAEAIIKDTNYKEVTRFALRSMTRMEEFYKEKYKHRIFYYELRLPHPSVIKKWKPKKIWRKWKLYSPAKNFTQHAESKSVEEIRTALRALSAVQNWDVALLTGQTPEREFLKTYFLGMLEPQLADMQVFKKEIATHTAPPNPPAMARVDVAHYIPSNNVPKLREVESLDLNDLIHRPEDVPFSLQEIEIQRP